MGLPKDTPEDVLVERAITDIENLLQQQTAPEDTAAIFLEPVIGEGCVNILGLAADVSEDTSLHPTPTSSICASFVTSTVSC
jgi:hypothetical protein